MWIEVVLNVPVFGSFTYSLPPDLEQEAAVGKRCEVIFGSRKMGAFIIKILKKLPADFSVPPEKIKPVLRLLDDVPLVTPELINLSRWIAAYYICAPGEALSAMIPSGRRETELPGVAFEEAIEKKPLTLSGEQLAAVEGIMRTVGRNLNTVQNSVQNTVQNVPQNTAAAAAPNAGANLHYLYGTTGSGKTEVFLQCAEAVLAQNQGVIYLVPEIALTHQVIEAVTCRFGPTVAILHSALTPSQKLKEWKRILNRQARVVVGARSAVFAPVPDLGLIIIDEEHDPSYKSGTTPRYHARQTAIKRCADHHIPLVMGSATPSAEAWFLMNEGRIVKHTLTKRLAGGGESKIRLVNMALKTGEGCISDELAAEIRAVKKENRQTILFLNRRGFTHFFVCKTCGHELKCKNCSVSLTYHKSEKRLRCHYCGWSLEPPSVCPECGSLDMGSSGFGTEFIETELTAKFPGFKTIRVDTDSIAKKGELEKALAAFRRGEADILLGTQMVAKGLNFPGVKLVGVVNADTGLHLPDFRAAERTFALIVQVAGRAGRFFPDGRVIVQSSCPEREAIDFACRGDFAGFYQQELEQREMLNFPPFSRLIRLVFRSKSAGAALEATRDAKHIIEDTLRTRFPAAAVDILGPAECPLAQISGNYRFQLLLRSKHTGPMQAACARLITGYKTPSGIYIEVDVDPVSLL